jgi:preprotein translocase subunit YajC
MKKNNLLRHLILFILFTAIWCFLLSREQTLDISYLYANF